MLVLDARINSIGTSSEVLRLSTAGGGVVIAKGTTAQRPVHESGIFRYNTTLNNVEFSDGSSWRTVVDSSSAQVDPLPLILALGS